MKKVLLATSFLLAIGAFTAQLFSQKQDGQARYELYQRRQWCPERVAARNAVRRSHRSGAL